MIVLCLATELLNCLPLLHQLLVATVINPAWKRFGSCFWMPAAKGTWDAALAAANLSIALPAGFAGPPIHDYVAAAVPHAPADLPPHVPALEPPPEVPQLDAPPIILQLEAPQDVQHLDAAPIVLQLDAPPPAALPLALPPAGPPPADPLWHPLAEDALADDQVADYQVADHQQPNHPLDHII